MLVYQRVPFFLFGHRPSATGQKFPIMDVSTEKPTCGCGTKQKYVFSRFRFDCKWIEFASPYLATIFFSDVLSLWRCGFHWRPSPGVFLIYSSHPAASLSHFERIIFHSVPWFSNHFLWVIPWFSRFPLWFLLSFPYVFLWCSHDVPHDVPVMFFDFPIFPIPSCNQTSQWKILKMKVFIGTSYISMVHFPAMFDDTRGEIPLNHHFPGVFPWICHETWRILHVFPAAQGAPRRPRLQRHPPSRDSWLGPPPPQGFVWDWRRSPRKPQCPMYIAIVCVYLTLCVYIYIIYVNIYIYI